MNIPESVSRFLEGKNLAVAGVSRKAGHTGNVVFRKLKKAGYNVVPLNPHAAELEGVRCYPDVTSVPVRIDGVVVTAHPRVSEEIITQCARAGVRRVWLHRSFGKGSVSEKAVRLAGEQNIECIAGGCPLMFCDPVDFPPQMHAVVAAEDGKCSRVRRRDLSGTAVYRVGHKFRVSL